MSRIIPFFPTSIEYCFAALCWSPAFVHDTAPPLHADARSVIPILRLVRIYLCRHAQAKPGEPDELRELTPEGLEQARDLGTRLAALPAPPRLVLTSPLIRARQTGAAVAEVVGVDDPRGGRACAGSHRRGADRGARRRGRPRGDRRSSAGLLGDCVVPARSRSGVPAHRHGRAGAGA